VSKKSSWDAADPAVADADPGVGNTAPPIIDSARNRN
jgi:hypothetical protein